VQGVGLGFMHLLNSGALALRMAAGGLVNSMATVGPQPVYIRAGGAPSPPQERSALFHLTIADKTFRNLSAPESTAREMYNHARGKARSQMGPAQGWKK